MILLMQGTRGKWNVQETDFNDPEDVKDEDVGERPSFFPQLSSSIPQRPTTT